MQAFDALVAALDTRGTRESHLHSMLQRVESTFKEAIRRNKNHDNFAKIDGYLVKSETGTSDMTSSSDCHTEVDSPSSTLCGLSSDSLECSGSFKIEFGRNEMERNAFSKRYKTLLKLMWKECYSPSVLCAMKYGKRRCPELLQTCPLCYHAYFMEERHCSSCHKTFKPTYDVNANFSEHASYCETKQKMDPDWIYEVFDSLPHIGLQLLKAQLSLMEVQNQLILCLQC